MDKGAEIKLTRKDKKIILCVSSLAAGVGAILGIIAYYNQWLG